MRFSKISVCGHRRSGTHYVAALISTNFLKNNNYMNIYEKHKLPEKFKLENKQNAIIVVKRNFKDTAKSIFKMRNRFGLKTDNYINFLNSTYKEMWNPDLKVKIDVVTLTNKKTVDKVGGGGLKNINKTPKDYWDYYYNKWHACLNYNNVMMVSYEDICNKFEDTMEELASFLGSKNKKFKKIEEKIGWIP